MHFEPTGRKLADIDDEDMIYGSEKNPANYHNGVMIPPYVIPNSPEAIFYAENNPWGWKEHVESRDSFGSIDELWEGVYEDEDEEFVSDDDEEDGEVEEGDEELWDEFFDGEEAGELWEEEEEEESDDGDDEEELEEDEEWTGDNDEDEEYWDDEEDEEQLDEEDEREEENEEGEEEEEEDGVADVDSDGQNSAGKTFVTTGLDFVDSDDEDLGDGKCPSDPTLAPAQCREKMKPRANTKILPKAIQEEFMSGLKRMREKLLAKEAKE